ncbi:hypothetical protein GCM10010276_80470 [Streptomyces longisporus]|uniref:Uncharacterized protein n=1 Tax=Streptomyces longisporus TaxID=1948 RepID=A0ABP6AM56_STRLO
MGLAELLSPDTFSTPQEESDRVIVDAATAMAVRRVERMEELTSGVFRTRAQLATQVTEKPTRSGPQASSATT